MMVWKILSMKSTTLSSILSFNLPLLETFALFVEESGIYFTLTLNFRKQAHLRQIEIKKNNYRYYTIEHEPGTHWRNINKPIILQEDQEEPASYVMNLA